MRSNYYRFDFAYAVIAVEASSGELRDNFEDVVGVPADVQNVLALPSTMR